MRDRDSGDRWLAPAWAFLAVVACFTLHACQSGPVRRPTGDLPGGPGMPRLRVGLSAGLSVDRVVVSCDTGMTAAAGDDTATLSGGSAEIRSEGGTLLVGDRSFPSEEVRLEPAGGGRLAVGGREYEGSILVLVRPDGKLDAVNEVGLEEYLAGVIGSEMSLSWPDECLRAQAIAARSYVLANLASGSLRARGRPFDLYDDERSQVYRGVEGASDRARGLVEDTRGLVLTSNGHVLTAYYHSTCGGRTDPAWEVLPDVTPDPPLGGAECGFCGSARYARWTAEIPVDEAGEALGVRGLRSVEVTSRTPAGRAKTVRVVGAAGPRDGDAVEWFRARLGGRVIRSAWWDRVEVRGGRLVIQGRGWGHGAGLCQMGAYRMAQEGRGALEILERYYPGARLTKRY